MYMVRCERSNVGPWNGQFLPLQWQK